jgi:serine/threonine protein kinase
LIDFGLATSFTPGTKLTDCPGTVMYVAPETWEKANRNFLHFGHGKIGKNRDLTRKLLI